MGQALKHLQVKEGELARVAAMLVNKSTGQVTSKNCAKVVIRDLDRGLVLVDEMQWD